MLFWAITIVVTVKYVMFVLRADNNGEGGVLALMALSLRSAVSGSPRAKLLMMLGVFGACMFYGDVVITPAISVLSAVEGLEIAAPSTTHVVIPLTLVIVVILFLIQRHGTSVVGRFFGPVMFLWFLSLALLGIYNIVKAPEVLVAINPYYAVHFMAEHSLQAFIVLGSVVLVLTGAEALYADMGHFGIKPIRSAWLFTVMPSLLINYFGQGANLIANPEAIKNPFYLMIPDPLVLPMVLLATCATVIASQAVISGAFSLVRQAIQLGYFPRLTVRHTNPDQRGQIFLPLVNVVLALGAIATVFGFKSSSALAAAYGIAVTGTMIVTTLALYAVMVRAWRWPVWQAAAVCLGFLALDAVFFASNLHKFHDGGWLPVFIALGVLAIMTTWKLGKGEIFRRVYANEITEAELCAIASSPHLVRVRGTGVFMAGNPTGTPLVLLHHVKANKVLHETVVLLSILTEEVPFVPEGERLEVRAIGEGIWRAVARYGYMESPDVAALIGGIRDRGVPLRPNEATYYFNREMIITGGDSRMWEWQKHFYGFLSRNARQARDYYQLPPMQIIEVGLPIQL
jgi:KUP system potassium uptake protein